MDFKLTHDFPCDPQAVWDIFNEPEFNRRLEERAQVRREVIEQTSEGGVEITRVRSTSLKELPPIMARAIGSSSLVFIQENRLDRERNVMEWSVTPTVMAERVDAHGTTRVEPTESGSRRTVEGSVKVRVPVVGKKMEQKVAENVRGSLEEAARLAQEMLKERC